MNLKKIKREIDKYPIISFDIFDTLLVRMTRNPHDIFQLIENYYNLIEDEKIKYFLEKRVNAEKLARSITNKEEILLDDIYKELDGFTLKQKDKLKKIEIEIEKKYLKINPHISEIYNYCIIKNKRIIIESDMYLPSFIIEEILFNNGIKYDKLFLSSKINKTKRNGSMYKYMLESLKIKPSQILHIGDSIKSDFIMAQRNNIKSILIKKYYNKSDKKITFKEFDRIIKNNTQTILKNEYEKLGFNLLGPLYLSFCKWLKNIIDENNVEKVFFLSRDGYIMKKSFEVKYDNVISHYLYVSRRGLITPALYYVNSYEELLELINIEVLESIDIETFIDKLGLEIDDCINEINNSGLTNKTKIIGSQIRNNKKVRKLYDNLKNKIKANSKMQLEELKAYLSNNDFNGKVAIVDIGWQGTMQKALNIIVSKEKLDVEIIGCYVGIKKSAIQFDKKKMFGFAFDPIENENEKKFFAFGGLFEYFYSNTEGSVKKYNNGDPVLLENEYDKTNYSTIMTMIQNGGLEYMKSASDYFDLYNISDDREYAIKAITNFGISPSLKNTKMFKKLYYSNIKNYYLLPQHSIFYYLFNLGKLKNEINQSFWKVGYLKELLKMPLPYYKIYESLKRR